MTVTETFSRKLLSKDTSPEYLEYPEKAGLFFSETVVDAPESRPC